MAFTFSITETMRGVHHFVDPARGPAVDRPFHFRIDWGAPLASSLNPLADGFMRYQAEGELFADGLTPSAVTCRGTLGIDYFAQHTITYALDFEAGGERYHYEGTKTDVRLTRPLQLIKTHTTCYGTLRDASGTIISRSVLHFPPDTTLPFLRSFRLRWRR
ncbi:MAG: hypothetical protein ACOC1F_00900 [Myxococcota bacterium]